MSSLPASALRKFEAIKQVAMDADGLAQAASEAFDVQRKFVRDLIGAQRPASDIAAAQAKLDQAQARVEARHIRVANDRKVVAQLSHWVATVGARAPLEAVPAAAVKLQKGESPSQALDRIRDDIGVMRAEMRRVQLAPASTADLKAQATAYVADLAAKGRPLVNASCGTLAVDWRRAGAWAQNALSDVALHAWLNPAAMEASLHREIDALNSDDANAITAADKAKRVAELEAQILEAERGEESLIEQAQLADQYVPRRPRASPLAVLGVQVKVRAARAA